LGGVVADEGTVKEVRVKQPKVIVFMVLSLLALPTLAGGQQPTIDCPKSKPAQSSQRQIAAHGFSFRYHSLVFEVGRALWCHERATINDGPAVFVTWRDALGLILDGHMVAGKNGKIRSIAWEPGQPGETPSTIKYGGWEPSYSEGARNYRSTSELKTTIGSDPKQLALPPMVSGLDATVMDREKKPHRILLRLNSEVLGKEAPYVLRYLLVSQEEGLPLKIASPSQLTGGLELEVTVSGRLGAILRVGTRLYPRELQTFFSEGVKSVSLESAELRIFRSGKPLMSTRISAYVPTE
jgi:hypothetical protein